MASDEAEAAAERRLALLAALLAAFLDVALLRVLLDGLVGTTVDLSDNGIKVRPPVRGFVSTSSGADVDLNMSIVNRGLEDGV